MGWSDHAVKVSLGPEMQDESERQASGAQVIECLPTGGIIELATGLDFDDQTAVDQQVGSIEADGYPAVQDFDGIFALTRNVESTQFLDERADVDALEETVPEAVVHLEEATDDDSCQPLGMPSLVHGAWSREEGCSLIP